MNEDKEDNKHLENDVIQRHDDHIYPSFHRHRFSDPFQSLSQKECHYQYNPFIYPNPIIKT